MTLRMAMKKRIKKILQKIREALSNSIGQMAFG
jgi:hypothetical protein